MLISEIFKLPILRLTSNKVVARQKLITEGGNAVPDVSRINQENVAATMDDIYTKLLPLLGINKKNTALLGSTGKKLPGGSSGDVDLAIDKPLVMKLNNLKTSEDLYKFLINCVSQFGYPFNYLKGLGIVSVAWPIANTDSKQEGASVQLDIMPSDNLKMTAWGMSSPHQSVEQYKGAVRNELLYWIATEVDYKALKQQYNELTGETEDLEFERTMYDMMRGLFRAKQTYISPKTGKRIKTKSTVSKVLLTADPNAVVKLLFGKEANPDDLITAKSVWDALMSPEFPYPEARKRIVTRTIKGLQKKGLDYPPYFDEYVGAEKLNESTGTVVLERTETTFDSPRKSMTKIHQMKPDEFVEFLEALKSKGITTSKKFDLSEFNTTEKADGMGVRLVCYDGKIGIESSYSGVVFSPDEVFQEPFRETLRYFQTEHANDLLSISKRTNTWFKITGELFYVNDPDVIDQDSGVTFIATKYDSKKIGRIGAMVVFDASAITADGQLHALEPAKKKEIISAFKYISNPDFKIYNDSDFSWNGSIDIKIDYDTEMMNRIFEEPTVLLKKECREHFKELRQAIADAFSREISKKGSVFGLPGSEVEGIVFEINGQKYGATNFNWAEKKKGYWHSHDEFFGRIAQFLKSVTGFQKKGKLKELLDAPDAQKYYSVPYRNELPAFLADMQRLKEQFDNDTSIPRATKKQQAKFIENAYKKVMKLEPSFSSLREFIHEL